MRECRNPRKHAHVWLYDVNKIEPEVRRYLKSMGIEVHLTLRAVDVEKIEGSIRGTKKISGIHFHDGSYVEGDVFIEATGSTGPMRNC